MGLDTPGAAKYWHNEARRNHKELGHLRCWDQFEYVLNGFLCVAMEGASYSIGGVWGYQIALGLVNYLITPGLLDVLITSGLQEVLTTFGALEILILFGLPEILITSWAARASDYISASLEERRLHCFVHAEID